MDLIGPLPISDRYKYVLTIKDVFSKWVEARPLEDKTAETTASGLLDVILRWGMPKEIISDQGKEFVAQVQSLLANYLSYKRQFSTPYHPQTNGQVEQFNRTLKGILRKYINKQGSN
jgi:transposase InsO family protein